MFVKRIPEFETNFVIKKSYYCIGNITILGVVNTETNLVCSRFDCITSYTLKAYTGKVINDSRQGRGGKNPQNTKGNYF